MEKTLPCKEICILLIEAPLLWMLNAFTNLEFDELQNIFTSAANTFFQKSASNHNVAFE
jgi:hypothetical protein